MMFIYIIYLQPGNYLHVKHSVQTTSHWPARGIALWNILNTFKNGTKHVYLTISSHVSQCYHTFVLLMSTTTKNAQLFFYKCGFVYVLHCMHYFHLHHHKRCITEMLLSLRYMCINKILQRESKLEPTNQKLRTGTASLMFS